MRRTPGWIGLLCLLIGLTAAATGQQKKEDLSFRDQAMLAKVLFQYREHKTLSQTVRGKMSITADDVDISADIAGNVKMAQPNLLFYETKITFFGKDKQGQAITNGKTIWEFDADGNQYTERPFTIAAKTEDKFTDWLTDRANADLTPILFLEAASGKMFDLPKGASQSIEVKDYPTQALEGRSVYVVPVPIKEKNAKGQATLYVDTESLLVQRCRFQLTLPPEKNGPKKLKVDFILDYSDIKTDEVFDENTFIFTPPDGAKKVKAVKSVFDRAFE
jgi:outer membrane lipoprotein-sorting protein